MEIKRPATIDRAKFDLDLLAGETWETTFLGLIGNGKLECKLDRMARRTGNLFIEYKCRGHPSGLAVTEAAWWIIGIEGPTGDVETAILASVPWLKEICGRLFKAGRTASGGDNGLSRGVLLNIADTIRMPHDR